MPKGNQAAREVSALRREITDLVSRNAVAMVQNAIDAVNEGGQYQAMKYLFEMIGLYPAAADPDHESERPLAAILLEQLGIESAGGVTEKRRVKKKNTGDPLQ